MADWSFSLMLDARRSAPLAPVLTGLTLIDPPPACESLRWRVQGHPQAGPPCDAQRETSAKFGPRKSLPRACVTRIADR
jgi:hypothetical protein